MVIILEELVVIVDETRACQKSPVGGLVLFWISSFRLGTEYWTGWAPSFGRMRYRELHEGWVPQIGRVWGEGVLGWRIFGVRCW